MLATPALAFLAGYAVEIVRAVLCLLASLEQDLCQRVQEAKDHPDVVGINALVPGVAMTA